MTDLYLNRQSRDSWSKPPSGSLRGAAVTSPRPPGSDPWPGLLYLWAGGGLYLGPAFDTSIHAHHALQICFSLETPFRLRAESGSRWLRYRTAIVPSNSRHQLDGGGGLLGLVYLDPQASQVRGIRPLPAARRFGSVPAGQGKLISSRLRDCWQRRPSTEELAKACGEILHIFMTQGAEQETTLDSRIARAIEVMQTAPGKRVTATALAAEVGLSPSRLRHLFRAQTGLPVRRYLLWLRLADALQEITRGLSLTQAAHAAGFADSAHMSRTCRRMFGVTPSALVKPAR